MSAYRDFGDPEHGLPPGIVPLMDRGYAMWTLVDFRTTDGQVSNQLISDTEPTAATDNALVLVVGTRDGRARLCREHRVPTRRSAEA